MLQKVPGQTDLLPPCCSFPSPHARVVPKWAEVPHFPLLWARGRCPQLPGPQAASAEMKGKLAEVRAG